MNAKTAITSLKPLEGHRIAILTNTNTYTQDCIRVYHLLPDQRQTPDQGNVLLWNGLFTTPGLPTGITLSAKNILVLKWHSNTIARILTRQHTLLSIIKLSKLPRRHQEPPQ